MYCFNTSFADPDPEQGFLIAENWKNLVGKYFHTDANQIKGEKKPM
jgi:hypothetical protein